MYVLAYNLPSRIKPDHVPGDPAHADGGKLIEVRPDQLALARVMFPDGTSLSVIEIPDVSGPTLNIEDWAPKRWAALVRGQHHGE